MTVAELIEKLKTMPQDMPVVIWYECSYELAGTVEQIGTHSQGTVVEISR